MIGGQQALIKGEIKTWMDAPLASRLLLMVNSAPAYALLWSVTALLFIEDDAAMLAFMFC